ncbi:lysogenization regulator HflD [Marinomonas sp. 42_23_T18]|nr:lysogenization regulator HflD [Marinomonas sp. 42_23_T18]
MSTQYNDQAIALSALFQAAELVSQLAKNGSAPEAYLRPLLDSILKTNVDSTDEIYGGHWQFSENLQLGNTVCQKTIGKDKTSVNPDTIRYALSILHLESKLAKQPQMLSDLGQRIGQLVRQKEHYEDTIHPNMIAAISGIYQDNLSKLNFRIQVHGNSRYLQQSQVSDQVRASLLAGVRAAMLWRQLGGRRWHLVFKRKPILTALTSFK